MSGTDPGCVVVTIAIKIRMSLTGSDYLAFLVLLFLPFWLLLRWRIAAVLLVTAANVFFLSRWGWIYPMALPAAALIDFCLAVGLSRSKHSLLRRLLVFMSIAMNLGLIVITKLPAETVPFTLTLGLSFYAFQAMTYTIDIYRGDAKPAANFFTTWPPSPSFQLCLPDPLRGSRR